jgi:hypothetical protein
MTRFLRTAKFGKPAPSVTFRSYLRTRLMASVFLVVAIIGGSLYYCLNQAFESEFLARARAEKNLAEEVLRDRIQNIEKRLREVANNNTVKITLMLGVKPQLKELLQEICPPRDGAHYFVYGGPDHEFYPEKPEKLIQLIKTVGSHNFEAKPFFIPDRLTLIFAQPLNRNDETIGTAYCVYNLSQDDSLEIQLHQIGNNWFYFQTPDGLKRLDNFLREETPSRHPLLTNHDDFQPYLWGIIAGVSARSYLFESLYYFVPTLPLRELQTRMYYVIGGISLLLIALVHPFATLLTKRLSSPLQKWLPRRAVSPKVKILAALTFQVNSLPNSSSSPKRLMPCCSSCIRLRRTPVFGNCLTMSVILSGFRMLQGTSWKPMRSATRCLDTPGRSCLL